MKQHNGQYSDVSFIHYCIYLLWIFCNLFTTLINTEDISYLEEDDKWSEQRGVKHRLFGLYFALNISGHNTTLTLVAGV